MITWQDVYKTEEATIQFWAQCNKFADDYEIGLMRSADLNQLPGVYYQGVIDVIKERENLKSGHNSSTDSYYHSGINSISRY